MKQFDSPPNVQMIEPLSTREREILVLMAEHRSNKEIASSLHLALSTVKWYMRQIFGKLEVENRRAAVERAVALHLIGEDHRTSIPQNLPVSSTSFIGRGAEIEEILGLLTAPEPRLVTLLGPGGSGKTRLAVQAASILVENNSTAFSNGIWFASLAPLENPGSILQTIASAMGFVFYDREREPLQQLLDYLRQRHVLLVLDNFEHLLSAESAHFVTEIISQAPYAKMLVTSRSRLNVQGEQLFPVAGMKTPGEGNDLEEEWDTFSAIRLFRECARRIQPNFEINAKNSASILRICQLVEGMPLGIEMATAWLELLTPEEIVTEIERSFDFLQTQGIEERHQSLRVVFNTSWKLLSLEEQNALMALTVFQGNFTREAAQQVSETSLNKLLSLVNKSWLTKDIHGRFHIHELLRQFAHEKLRSDPPVWEKAHANHAHYFAALMGKLGELMKGPRQLEAFDLTGLEFENIVTAWTYLVDHKQFNKLIEQMLTALALYSEAKFRGRDFLTMVRYAHNMLENELTSRDKEIHLNILTLAEMAFYGGYCNLWDDALLGFWTREIPTEGITTTWRTLSKVTPDQLDGYWIKTLATLYALYVNEHEATQRLLELKLIVTEQPSPWLLGIINQTIGRFIHQDIIPQSFGESKLDQYPQENRWEVAKVFLQDALSSFQAAGDRLEQGRTLEVLGVLNPSPERTALIYHQAKELYEAVGNVASTTVILNNLAQLSFVLGKFDEGFAYFHQEQAFAQSIGNQSLLANAHSWESIEALRYSDISHARRTREVHLTIYQNELSPKHKRELQDLHDTEVIYAWGLWESGEIERVAGDFENAARLYNNAGITFRKLDIKSGLSFYHRGLGDLALMQGKYETARQEFQTALDLAVAVKHVWLESYVRCGLGRAALMLEDFEGAREEFLEALRTTKDHTGGLQQIAMIALTGLALWHHATGDLEGAVELSSFVLGSFVPWNETKHHAHLVLDEASRQLPAKIVEAASERGKDLLLEDILKKYLAEE